MVAVPGSRVRNLPSLRLSRRSPPWTRGTPSYDAHVQAPARSEEWFAITERPLEAGAAYEWAVRPDCGAVVLFSGTVRDHADGRDGVESLEYEAYESAALARFEAIGAELRRRWPTAGRVVIWHRVGLLGLGESAVIVAVSAPHRDEGFDAARFAIDTLKAAAPIWKRETWSGGDDWGTGSVPIAAVDETADAVS